VKRPTLAETVWALALIVYMVANPMGCKLRPPPPLAAIVRA
jgi:hypothetical protein